MVIDESSISPITITLEGNVKKKVIQAWVYVFYNTPYAPYTLKGKTEPYKTNKYLTYFSVQEKTSATKAFYFYDAQGSLISRDISSLKLSDFKSIKPKTIGDIQLNIVKSSQE